MVIRNQLSQRFQKLAKSGIFWQSMANNQKFVVVSCTTSKHNKFNQSEDKKPADWLNLPKLANLKILAELVASKQTSELPEIKVPFHSRN